MGGSSVEDSQDESVEPAIMHLIPDLTSISSDLHVFVLCPSPQWQATRGAVGGAEEQNQGLEAAESETEGCERQEWGKKCGQRKQDQFSLSDHPRWTWIWI